jgi:Domain of unknown function (DUF4365)
LISKPEQHDIDQAGNRLLRDVLESFGWVVNDTQRDYGIDSNVQVFEKKSATGAWFHVQLKSSASSEYSADGRSVSQELSGDHARHYALEMRQPIFLIHADVASKKVYWCAPQLDKQLAASVRNVGAKSVTVRIPTAQILPASAPEFLKALRDIHLALANREITSASNSSFSDSLKHIPDQDVHYRAFQEKNNLLKLRKIADFYKARKYEQARLRAIGVSNDPDASIEAKVWALTQLGYIDSALIFRSGKPQSEMPEALLSHARSLQKVTKQGPAYLKFYALIMWSSAELGVLVHKNHSLFLAEQQHAQTFSNPMLALTLFAERSEVTRRVVAKYNQCLRLVRYAANYPDRWMLSRALIGIVNEIGHFLITLRSENKPPVAKAFAESAFRICKLAAWISKDAGDEEGATFALLGALITTNSEDTDQYRWALETAQTLPDDGMRADVLLKLERTKKRWAGELVEGDYHGDTIWQIIQNMASQLGVDLSDENDPLVRGLRIAAKDNTSKRVLGTCEHILDSLGATGPIARQIARLFNISTAGSKVIHCTLHNHHVEGKDLDSAYAEFKRRHCDSCPDRKPRPEGWRGTPEEIREIQSKHRDFVANLTRTANGFRYASQD